MSSLFAPPSPTVAIELAARRLTVVEVGRSGRRLSVVGYATEALADNAIVPSSTAANIPNPQVVIDALARALERAGVRSTKRAAVVVPDSVARVSLLTFEQLPAKAADVDQLIRWQLKKGTPFPIEDAQVSWTPAHKLVDGSQVLAAAVSKRSVITEYESVVSAAGIHAGLVDLASFNVMNAVIGAGAASVGDWLLVSMAPEGTTLEIGRGADLMFYRHRGSVGDEPLSVLVHQTAMYLEDRLGGTQFQRVWLAGGGVGKSADQARTEIQRRLGVPVEVVDVRGAAELAGRVNASPDMLDALAAPVGVLMRGRAA